MDKPDLHEMDRTARGLHDALDELRRELEEAESAAAGEWDEETDSLKPDTGNGDVSEVFFEAAAAAHDAVKAVESVRRLLATQHGLREFEARVEA